MKLVVRIKNLAVYQLKYDKFRVYKLDKDRNPILVASTHTTEKAAIEALLKEIYRKERKK